MTEAPAIIREISNVDRDSTRVALAVRMIDWVQFVGLCTLLCFGPLAFGVVNDWSVFVLEFGTACLALLWLLKSLFSDKLRVIPSPLYPPIIAFAILISYQIAAGTAVYRYVAITEFCKYIAYGIFFFLVLDCLRYEARLKIFVSTLIGFGFLLALFAVIQDLTSNGRLYWVFPQPLGLMYGPYVNHNHYAGIMEMLAPLPLVLCMTRLVGNGKKLFLGIGSMVMGASIVLSLSRGGTLSLVAEVIVLAVYFWKRRGGRIALGFGAALVVTIAFLGWLGTEQIVDRMAALEHPKIEPAAIYRLTIARDGLQMFRARPLLGWGLGGFPIVYPQYRSFYSNLVADVADDDYIQLLVETGLLGFALMIWFLLLLYHSGFRNLGKWESNWNAAMTLAALVGCTGILVHSFTDSNLHIPGNAAMFYALCALASANVGDRPWLHRVNPA